MRTRGIFWERRRPVCGADKLATFIMPVVYKSWEPQTPGALRDSFSLNQAQFISLNSINQFIFVIEKKGCSLRRRIWYFEYFFVKTLCFRGLNRHLVTAGLRHFKTSGNKTRNKEASSCSSLNLPSRVNSISQQVAELTASSREILWDHSRYE